MALTDNLIAYYSLDEASGDAIDAHGSLDLTETAGTIGSATGKVGNCRDFEADDTEHFEIADSAAAELSAGDVDFSFACWIQAEAFQSNNSAISKWNTTGTGKEYLLFVNTTTSRLTFRVSNDGTSNVDVVASSFGAVSTGTWYFVVCWHDAANNQIGISVNGTANTAAHTTGVNDSTSAFMLGGLKVSGTPSNLWDGLIDEVGFWKRVLTSDERTELYNSGNGRDYAYISTPPADTFTADGAVTTGGIEVSGTADFVPDDVFAADGAVTLGGIEVAGTASFVADDVFAADGAVTSGGIEVAGTASFVADDVFAADGAVTTGGVEVAGTASFVADDVFAADGAVTIGGVEVAGTATVEAVDAFTATGAVTTGGIEVAGTADFVPDDVFAADGAVTFGGIEVAGTASFTADTVFAADGAVTIGGVEVSGEADLVPPGGVHKIPLVIHEGQVQQLQTSQSLYDANDFGYIVAEDEWDADDRIIVSVGTMRAVESSSVTITNVVTAAAAFATDDRLIASDGTGKGVKVTTLDPDDIVVDSDITNMVTADTAFGTDDVLIISDGTAKAVEASAVAIGNVVTAAAAAAADNLVLRSDGSTKAVQDSGVTLDDSDVVSGVTRIDIVTAATNNAHVQALTVDDADSALVFELRVSDTATNNLVLGTGTYDGITTGINNLAIGKNAGESITEADGCLCIGSKAGQEITTGDNNFCLGANAGALITTGAQNFCLGSSAGNALTTTNSNVCIGTSAGGNLTGANNFCLGTNSGASLTSPNSNIFIGSNAGNNASQGATVTRTIGLGGSSFTGGNDSIAIGQGANTTGANAIAIGSSVSAAANQVILGSDSVTATLLRGDITIEDGHNLVLNATTGTKLGTAVTQKLGFWNATPIVQPASADQAAVSLDVDVTGSDTVDKAAIDSNFTAIQTLLNQLRADLVSAGIIKGAA